MRILDTIKSPQDLKKLSLDEQLILANELRQETIQTVSKTGGHLASNLGVVELTIAIHTVFNTPRDKIIWDVGHQVYIHKMLTGRLNQMPTLRQFNGLSGYPKTSESEYDVFNAGHSSTSISAALGIARARDILHEKYRVVAVIGDGSLTGGMALEALNDAGASKTNLIVILNDNGMSIASNTGGLANLLTKARTRSFYTNSNKAIRNFFLKIPVIGVPIVKMTHRFKYWIKSMIISNMMFEDIGFKYLGPVDGNNLEDVETLLRAAKDLEGPVLIHCKTVKGKGYAPAEQNPEKFHGTSAFDIKTGQTLSKSKKDFSAVFGETLCEMARTNGKICAITAAMPLGTGLSEFKKTFPNRFFDVEIAEQHAITMSAGLARGGCIPVVPIYASFMQRAYDQVIHDVCMQNLHVVMCFDRAGAVGADGETHQGIFDFSFMRVVPNVTIMAPRNFTELKAMLHYAVEDCQGPVMIRYPRGSEDPIDSECDYDSTLQRIKQQKAELLSPGQKIMICSIGKMGATALKVKADLKEHGLNPLILNVSFLKPLDIDTIKQYLDGIEYVFTIEDGAIDGGLYIEMLERFKDTIKLKGYGYPQAFIPHGKVEQIEKAYHLDHESIAKDILETIK